MLSRLFIAALWSPAGKGLTPWLLFVMFYCVFVTIPCGILGQVWYLIVSIPECNMYGVYLFHILLEILMINKLLSTRCLFDYKNFLEGWLIIKK